MHFENKTIWITGASSGIGAALAAAWAGHKTRLILSARNREKLEAVQKKAEEKGAEVLVVPMDLANGDSIRNACREVMARFPVIDILVNNGGISQRSNVEETPVEIDRRIMETNFFGAITLTKEVIPSMIHNKAGHIVVISSVVGKFGFPLRSAYSASKHALQGYFDSLRAELQQKNIRVTIISPGRIRTDISLNAIVKDGSRHGVMDPGQARGIPVATCAKKIIKAIENNKKDVVIARQEKIMVFFRKFLPGIYYRLAARISAT